MLSRRERLLIQPWEQRRFKDHRSKVACALPAVDARAPALHAHVAVKLKKWQRERERAARVAADNRALLQRLGAVVRARRLDDRWDGPPRNFQHKVGQYYDARELCARLAARRARDQPEPAPTNVKCYACEARKMRLGEAARRGALPALP